MQAREGHVGEAGKRQPSLILTVAGSRLLRRPPALDAAGEYAVPFLIADDCHVEDSVSPRTWAFPVRCTEEFDECIRPGTPLSLDDARRLVEGYVDHYNNVRLNSAVGYVTPKDMLAGRQQEIHDERDRKLEEARKRRQVRRQNAA
jgi:hypothetical protein